MAEERGNIIRVKLIPENFLEVMREFAASAELLEIANVLADSFVDRMEEAFSGLLEGIGTITESVERVAGRARGMTTEEMRERLAELRRRREELVSRGRQVAGGGGIGGMLEVLRLKGMTGAISTALKGIGIPVVLMGVFDILKKSSPLLKQVVDLLNQTFFMVLRPIGDIMGLILMPVALFLLQYVIVPFYRYVYPAVVAIAEWILGGYEAFTAFVDDLIGKQKEMFSEVFEEFDLVGALNGIESAVVMLNDVISNWSGITDVNQYLSDLSVALEELRNKVGLSVDAFAELISSFLEVSPEDIKAIIEGRFEDISEVSLSAILEGKISTINMEEFIALLERTVFKGANLTREQMEALIEGRLKDANLTREQMARIISNFLLASGLPPEEVKDIIKRMFPELSEAEVAGIIAGVVPKIPPDRYLDILKQTFPELTGEDVVEVIKLPSIGEVIGALLEDVKEDLGGIIPALDNVIENINAESEKIPGRIVAVFQGFIDFLSTEFDNLQTDVSNVMAGVENILNELKMKFDEAFNGFVEWLSSVWEGFITELGNNLSTIQGNIWGNLSGIWDLVVSTGDRIMGIFSDFVATVMPVGGWIKDKIYQIFFSAWDALKPIRDWIANAITDIFRAAENALQPITSLAQAISDLFRQAKEFLGGGSIHTDSRIISELFREARDNALTMYEHMKDMSRSFVRGREDVVESLHRFSDAVRRVGGAGSMGEVNINVTVPLNVTLTENVDVDELIRLLETELRDVIARIVYEEYIRGGVV